MEEKNINNLNSRLLQIMDYKGLSNTDIAKMFDLGASTVSNIINGNRPMAKNIKNQFETIFDDIDKSWFLYGGNENIVFTKKTKSPNIDDFLKKQLEEKDKTIDILRNQLAMLQSAIQNSGGLQLGKAKVTKLIPIGIEEVKENRVGKVIYMPVSSMLPTKQLQA